MNKTRNEKIEDILMIIASIVFIISITLFFITGIKSCIKTNYAKITGENFTIPKIEGAYYYER